MFFKAAPVGDPKGKMLLTVQAHPNGRPDLLVVVHKGDETLFDVTLPLDALILVGIPSQGVDDANVMLTLLDKAAAALPDWTKGRARFMKAS